MVVDRREFFSCTLLLIRMRRSKSSFWNAHQRVLRFPSMTGSTSPSEGFGNCSQIYWIDNHFPISTQTLSSPCKAEPPLHWDRIWDLELILEVDLGATELAVASFLPRTLQYPQCLFIAASCCSYKAEPSIAGAPSVLGKMYKGSSGWLHDATRASPGIDDWTRGKQSRYWLPVSKCSP